MWVNTEISVSAEQDMTYNISNMTFGILVIGDINLRELGELVENLFHKKRVSFSKIINHDFCDFKEKNYQN